MISFLKQKLNGRTMLLLLLLCGVLVIFIARLTLSAVTEENHIRVKEKSELTYYLDVIYDGKDSEVVTSSDSATAEVKSNNIYVEDKIPEGLTFKRFLTSEDGTIGAVKRSDGSSCSGYVVDDAVGLLQARNQVFLIENGRVGLPPVGAQALRLRQELVIGLDAEVVEVVFAVLDAHALQELGHVLIGDGVAQDAVPQLLGAVGILRVEDDVAIPVSHGAAPLTVPGHQLGNLGADEHVLRLALDFHLVGGAVVVAAHRELLQPHRGLAGLDGVVHQVEQNLVLQVRAADADAGQILQADGRRRLLPLVARRDDVVRGVDNQRLDHAEPPDAVLQGFQSLGGDGARVVLRPRYLLDRHFLDEINHCFQLPSADNLQSCPSGFRRSRYTRRTSRSAGRARPAK